MKPQNESNFLIEVTPEVMDELNRLYRLVDERRNEFSITWVVFWVCLFSFLCFGMWVSQ